jgi:hypothetical protein
MAMFCTKCGSELKIDGNFCGGCGAAVAQPGGVSVESVLVDHGKVSIKWQKTFDLIAKAGGREGRWMFPWTGQLTFFERSRLHSVSAFLLGPVYYLAKGMWRQAISYTGVFTAVTAAITYAGGVMGIKESLDTNLMEAVLFGVVLQQRAKYDYYRKCVLGYNGWW